MKKQQKLQKMIKMVYDIEEKDLENMKLNAVQLLSEQISALQDDIEQKIDDSRGSGKFDEFDEVLQLYLYDKDYS